MEKATTRDTKPVSVKDRLIAVLREDWLTLAIVLGLVVAYAILRTPSDSFASEADLQAALSTGKPTVVELFANNCSICLVSKPRVDQLERDLADHATVLRLNVRRDLGQTLAYRWSVTGVPTFFVFDGRGEVVYRRSGAPDVRAIEDAVASLPRPSD